MLYNDEEGQNTIVVKDHAHDQVDIVIDFEDWEELRCDDIII